MSLPENTGASRATSAGTGTPDAATSAPDGSTSTWSFTGLDGDAVDLLLEPHERAAADGDLAAWCERRDAALAPEAADERACADAVAVAAGSIREPRGMRAIRASSGLLVRAGAGAGGVEGAVQAPSRTEAQAQSPPRDTYVMIGTLPNDRRTPTADRLGHAAAVATRSTCNRSTRCEASRRDLGAAAVIAPAVDHDRDAALAERPRDPGLRHLHADRAQLEDPLAPRAHEVALHVGFLRAPPRR